MRDESIDLSFLKTFINKFLFINLTGKASTILTFSVFFFIRMQIILKYIWTQIKTLGMKLLNYNTFIVLHRISRMKMMILFCVHLY